MALINYTSYEDIRAALGVTDEELDDDTLGLQLYEDHLKADLEDVSYDVDTVHAGLEGASTLTATEERFMRASRLFATYSVAKALTNTLPMFGQKSVEDGKAKVERFTDPYRATVLAVNSEFERWRSKLKATYEAIGQVATTTSSRVYAMAVTPSSDPITGT
jgi:hypothetical protein